MDELWSHAALRKVIRSKASHSKIVILGFLFGYLLKGVHRKLSAFVP